jgi:hypothetical protein
VLRTCPLLRSFLLFLPVQFFLDLIQFDQSLHWSQGNIIVALAEREVVDWERWHADVFVMTRMLIRYTNKYEKGLNKENKLN